jgi:3-oxoacyl-[acyl-carrier-protein] synthase II
MMDRRVVITGMGIVSPLGDDIHQFHSALCEGRSEFRAPTLFGAEGLPCQLSGEISGFSAKAYLNGKNLRALDRTSQLVAAAAALALETSGWSIDMRDREEVGIVLGTMFCSAHTISEFDRRALTSGPAYASPMDFANTVINAAAGQAAIWHNLRGINSTVSCGASSGLQSIAYASNLIRNGRAKALLAGGAEELCFETFFGFGNAGMLCGSNHTLGHSPIPFHRRRNGFVLSEGAALLMLEDLETAKRRDATILAEVLGSANAHDCSFLKDSRRSIRAVHRAITGALEDARITPEDVDCVSCSANGSVDGDRNEAYGIAAVFGTRAAKIPVTAIKAIVGECLGAAGSLQAADLLETIRSETLAGIYGLSELEEDFPLRGASAQTRPMRVGIGLINSIGFEGNCSSVVIGNANLN